MMKQVHAIHVPEEMRTKGAERCQGHANYDKRGSLVRMGIPTPSLSNEHALFPSRNGVDL